jgi:hypothetical protein
MILGTQGLREKTLPCTCWEKDDGFIQVEDNHTTALIESPSMPHCCRDGHLPTRRHEELCWHGHGHHSLYLVTIHSTKWPDSLAPGYTWNGRVRSRPAT